ncbi:MAG: tRNA pseudouridine(13) synthase TruD [Thermoproteus sp.]
MRQAPPFDASLGMEWYVTDVKPCGGKIKKFPEDFIVEEVLEGGLVVSIAGFEPPQTRPGPWLWVHIVKRDVDTLKLLETLQRSLRLRRGEVGIGGIKDTRAVSSHVISLYGVKFEDLPKINGVEYKRAWYAEYPISPSKIEGNRFTITIREIDVGCAAEALRELDRISVVPNYYGYQRFGTIRPVSHILGRALVRRDAEEFVRVMFCKVFEGESPTVKEARELACRGDYSKALSKMPKSMLEERYLLRALASGQNLWNAVMSIPYRVLKIYVEAYQAYLFNRILSLRLKDGPLGLLADDLVLEGDYPILASHSVGDKPPILPVPGSGLIVPESKARDYLRAVLKEEGIEMKDFALARIGASGSYRQAFTAPAWSFRDLAGDTAKLSFKMPRGSYATIVLREVIKPEEPRLHGF